MYLKNNSGLSVEELANQLKLVGYNISEHSEIDHDIDGYIGFTDYSFHLQVGETYFILSAELPGPKYMNIGSAETWWAMRELIKKKKSKFQKKS